MRIEKVKIKSFGKLKDFKLDFSPGLNIIYGSNEAGKSTLQYFIKSMFYGMNSQKKSIRENERKRFIPWEEDRAEGQLIFSDDNDIEYIIERSFGNIKKEDNYDIYNSITGAKAVHFDNISPGKDILGIGEEAFEKTLFIKQLGAQVGRDRADEIMKKLTNLHLSGDEDVSFHKAMNIIETCKKSIKGNRKKGILEELKENLSSLNLRKVNLEALHGDEMKDTLELKNICEEIDNKTIELNKLLEKRQITKKLLAYYQYNETINESKRIENIKKEIDDREAIYNGDIDEADFELLGLREAYSIMKERQRELAEVELKIKNIIEKRESLEIKMDKYKSFATLDDDVDKKVSLLISEKRELQLRLESERYKDNIKLRLDILNEKKKNAVFLSSIGFAAALSIIAAVILNNISFGAVALFGLGILIYGLYGYNKAKKEIVLLLRKENISEKLVKSEYDEIDIKEEISKIDKYIEFLFNHCQCNNIDEFNDKFKEFKEEKYRYDDVLKECNLFKEDKHRKQLQIENVIHDIEIMLSNFNIKAKDQEADNDIGNLIELIYGEIVQIKKLKEEYKASQNRYTNLVKGKDLEVILLEMEEIMKSIPNDILEYAREQRLFDESAQADDELDDLDDRISKINNSIVGLEKCKNELDYKIKEKGNKGSITEIEEQITSCKDKIVYYEDIYESAELAENVLQEAFDEVQSNFGPRLNKEVANIMSAITNGKYDDVRVSQDYEINIVDPESDKQREIEYLSGGTYDQIYFALRIGIINLIFQEKSVPVLLDDTFVQYDEERLESVLKFLYKYSEKNQVIIFTCRKLQVFQEDVNTICIS